MPTLRSSRLVTAIFYLLIIFNTTAVLADNPCLGVKTELVQGTGHPKWLEGYQEYIDNYGVKVQLINGKPVLKSLFFKWGGELHDWDIRRIKWYLKQIPGKSIPTELASLCIQINGDRFSIFLLKEHQ